MSEDTALILEARDLAVTLESKRVVDGLDLSVAGGEALGLVGESGSGKSQTALALMGLSPPGAEVTGTMRFRGEPLVPERVRGRRVAMVFQDPMSSLNPYLSVGRQVTEPMRFHLGLGRKAARERAAELLERVGLPEPVWSLDRYPHQLSGGMRQRVMLAMALSCGPELLICDEPTSALDVTVQAAILELLADLQEREGLALLFIAHDLAVVRQLCTRVLVMFNGRIVESGPVEQTFRSPRHPYTGALLDAVPEIAAPRRRGDGHPGPDTVAAASWSDGCAYRSRCPRAEAACGGMPPPWEDEVIRGHRCVRPL